MKWLLFLTSFLLAVTPVFAAPSFHLTIQDTTIGEPTPLIFSIDGLTPTTAYHVKVRLGPELDLAQTCKLPSNGNCNESDWLNDAGTNSDWDFFPVLTADADGTIHGEVIYRAKSTASTGSNPFVLRIHDSSNHDSVQTTVTLLPAPTPTITNTPSPSNTPAPTSAPSNTPVPTTAPSNTPRPTSRPTASPRPTPTFEPSATPFDVPEVLGDQATATPEATLTPTPPESKPGLPLGPLFIGAGVIGILISLWFLYRTRRQ